MLVAFIFLTFSLVAFNFPSDLKNEQQLPVKKNLEDEC